MTASDLTDDEWQRLDAEAKAALEAVIAAAENSGAYTSIGYEGGEVYAFPEYQGCSTLYCLQQFDEVNLRCHAWQIYCTHKQGSGFSAMACM